LLANGAAHFIQTGGEQVLRVEGRAAREQFVEQHAKAVNVAARVNVQAGQHRLLGTHVGGRADELFKRGEERLIGQPPRRGLGDAEVNHLGNGHAVVDGDEDVRGLDVAVNDAFLVRVLDGPPAAASAASISSIRWRKSASWPHLSARYAARSSAASSRAASKISSSRSRFALMIRECFYQRLRLFPTRNGQIGSRRQVLPIARRGY
jgi:hypothetical protein